MHVFPISRKVERRSQMAPHSIVIPMIGGSLPAETLGLVSCEIADREPINQATSKRRIATPLTPARRLEWIKVVLPDLCIVTHKRREWCFRIVEVFLKVVRSHAV